MCRVHCAHLAGSSVWPAGCFGGRQSNAKNGRAGGAADRCSCSNIADVLEKYSLGSVGSSGALLIFLVPFFTSRVTRTSRQCERRDAIARNKA